MRLDFNSSPSTIDPTQPVQNLSSGAFCTQPDQPAAPMRGTLVLARHGQSVYNKANVFTGFQDPPLSDHGRDVARQMAHKLLEQGYSHFDAIYVSDMIRTEETLRIQLAELNIDHASVPIVHTAQLRERDYGDITGCSKKETAEKYGKKLVDQWRRSWGVAPPNGESLEMTAQRVLPLFQHDILPRLNEGQSVLVTSHGNTLRSLCKVLEDMSEEEIERFQIGDGVVVVYQFEQGKLVDKHILEP